MNIVRLSMFRARRFIRRGLHFRCRKPLSLEDNIVIRSGWRKTLGCQAKIVTAAAQVLEAHAADQQKFTLLPTDRPIIIDVNTRTRYQPFILEEGSKYEVAASFTYQQKLFSLPEEITLLD